MNEISLHINTGSSVTIVQNTFIDNYMPSASGEFVKIYLYLLRCTSSNIGVSISSIADTFEHTEKDVNRALAYWEKLHLLKLEHDESGALTGICFLSSTEHASEPAAASVSLETAASTEPSKPMKKVLPSADKMKTLKEQEDIRQLLFIAEQYLGKTLSSTEVSNILYFYDGLHFSTDLIEYLIEYCVSKGSKSARYIEKVALSWAEDGSTTVDQAKCNTNLYNKNYFTILNTFGIKGRAPAEPEITFMAKWLDEYHFTLDIIIEACNRTIKQTHQPNFQYANKILEAWNKSGIKHLSEVALLDEKHQNSKKTAPVQKKPASSNNRFNNFHQREYDYDQLEKQLLNR